jgi:hypothetical protein
MHQCHAAGPCVAYLTKCCRDNTSDREWVLTRWRPAGALLLSLQLEHEASQQRAHELQQLLEHSSTKVGCTRV